MFSSRSCPSFVSRLAGIRLAVDRRPELTDIFEEKPSGRGIAADAAVFAGDVRRRVRASDPPRSSFPPRPITTWFLLIGKTCGPAASSYRMYAKTVDPVLAVAGRSPQMRVAAVDDVAPEL